MMKNSQKIIALLLFASILSTCFVFANASSSAVKGGIIERLKAFDIIKDYDEAKNDEAITKAEFTDMLIRARNSQVKYAGDFTNSFDDVDSSYKYASSIQTAKDLGIVVGDGNNLFHPNSNVILMEAIKMVLCAMDCSSIAELEGGYPNGYIKVANLKRITAGVTGGYEKHISRKDAIMLVNNMLNAKAVMYLYGEVSYKESDETILEKYFAVEITDVIIKDIDKQKRTVIAEVTKGKHKGAEMAYNVSPNIDMPLVLGSSTFYVSKNDESLVLYIKTDAKSKVFYDYITEINKSSNDVGFAKDDIKTVLFKNDEEYYDTKDDLEIYYNDQIVTFEVNRYINCFAKIVIRDGEIARMDVYTLSEGGLIYYADTDELRFSTGDLYENTWYGFSKAKDLQIIIDGEPNKRMQDLKTDTIFDYWHDNNDKFIIVASSRAATGVLEGFEEDFIRIDGKDYELNKEFGYYNFNINYNTYERGGNYSEILGQTVKAIIDDNQTVRFIRIDTAKITNKTIRAVVIKTHKEKFSGRQLVKLYKIDGNNEEKVYYLKKKLSKDSLDFNYLKTVESDYNGMGFLEFTLNDKDEIIKIGRVDYFGYKTTHSGQFDSTNKTITSMSVAEATIFAIMPIEGEFTVKVLKFDPDLMWARSDSQIEVVSDFDARNNPLPNYIALTTGSETIRANDERREIISSISYIDSDEVELTFVGGNKYKVDKDFVDTYGLKKNCLLIFYPKCTGKYPIKVLDNNSFYDLSGDPENWQTDTFSTEATEGFFKADGIAFRNDNVIQFIVNGEYTDTYRFYESSGTTVMVFEYYRNNFYKVNPQKQVGSNVPDYIRIVQKYPIMNVQKGDDVWFLLCNNSTYGRIVRTVIYRSNANIF